jgi:hypothetical protein
MSLSPRRRRDPGRAVEEDEKSGQLIEKACSAETNFLDFPSIRFDFGS